MEKRYFSPQKLRYNEEGTPLKPTFPGNLILLECSPQIPRSASLKNSYPETIFWESPTKMALPDINFL